MSTIRRQSILSSLVIYIGFAVGMINTYFFTKENLFTTTQYGLTAIFFAIATMMMAFANLAMPSFISKFYHYYNDHLPLKKNDMLAWSLLVSLVGFALVMLAGWFFKDLVIRKYGANSPELIQYYYWIFPMGLGLTIYAVLESYTWNLGRPVLTNFLKEVVWRILISILIVLFILRIVGSFDLFIKLYAFSYLVVALILLVYLIRKKKIHFTLRPSKVSRRYFKKILTFSGFIYTGILVYTISQVFDTIVIASVLPQGIDKAGIFGLATLMANIIQAPQRGLNATTIPYLARAWKDKNRESLQRIYQRSSINMLLFSCGIFLLIALNYREAITTFNLKPEFALGFHAFLFMGLTRIIDLGTGVNSLIIATSNYWRFELISGMILLLLILPLTYVLTKQYDILGPAIAALISISIYNLIRILFLWKKFNLFPFSPQTIYTLLLSAACFILCYYLFQSLHGFPGLILRTIAFCVLFGSGSAYFKLSPDIQPVVRTILGRLGIGKRQQ